MKVDRDILNKSMEIAETLVNLESGISNYTKYQYRAGAQQAALILLQQFQSEVPQATFENIVLRILQNEH